MPPPSSPPAPIPSLFTLNGRHALVTGGGSGIGQLIADTLSAAGARVTLALPLPTMAQRYATGDLRHQ